MVVHYKDLFIGKTIEDIEDGGDDIVLKFTDGSQAFIYPTNESVIDLDGENELEMVLYEKKK